jgi:hypothetical protein
MFGYRDDELTARWVQLGVFSPIMRLHSSQSRWMSKEPWLYGLEAEVAIKEMLRFRHRLIPYLHTMNIRAAREGEQLVQPLYWHWPENKESYKQKNNFLFGSQLLVTPITHPHDKHTLLGSTKAWFPPGRYVDIFTGAVYDGDRTVVLFRRLNNIPVFAAEGSIIPLDHDTVPGTGSFNPERLEILLVVGKDGKFTLIEDDAKGNAGSVHISITYTQKDGTLHIDAAKPSAASPAVREWWIKLVACNIDEKNVRIYNDGSELSKKSITREANGTLLSLGSVPTSAGVTVHLGKDPQLRVVDSLGWVEDILMRAQLEFVTKSKIWSVVADKSITKANKALQLEALDLDANVRLAVMEALLVDSRDS